MSDLENKPVYPIIAEGSTVGNGITLRQHYAGLAMQGLLAGFPQNQSHDHKWLSMQALKHADTLIAALNTQSPTAKE